MGCGRNNNQVGGVESSSNCVCDVVNFINDLQDAVDENENCPTNCLRPVLGVVENVQAPNTRPFILYTKEGKPFEAFYSSNECPNDDDHDWYCKSKFFRVESVEDCCAVLRVLAPTSHTCNVVNNTDYLERTSSCITVDLNCFCAIQCLDDTFIPGV